MIYYNLLIVFKNLISTCVITVPVCTKKFESSQNERYVPIPNWMGSETTAYSRNTSRVQSIKNNLSFQHDYMPEANLGLILQSYTLRQ